MSFHLNLTSDNRNIYLILPGVSQGSTVGILKKITDRLETAGKTYVSITFPFQDKGLDSPESKDFEAEIIEVRRGLEKLEVRPSQVIIIGKSFGALIGAQLLTEIKDLYNTAIEFHVLGYIFDPGLDQLSQADKVFIYQGEHDRFGTPAAVAEQVPTAEVFTISGADHSYRNTNKEPEFEEVAVDALFAHISL